MDTTRRPPVASLQDELDRITQNTRALVQRERLAFSERATAELFATGIEGRVLPPGMPAPQFTLPNAATGKPVSSADLVAMGPLVIKFFRGRWCPYCMTELETWRERYQEVRSLGALLVAISPQCRKQNELMVQQHHLPFPVLTDEGAAVAERFGLAYAIPEEHRDYYKSILVNIPFVNGGVSYKDATESHWRLGLPGTFVVRQDGVIGFSEAHADFRVRPEPADVLDVLRSL